MRGGKGGKNLFTSVATALKSYMHFLTNERSSFRTSSFTGILTAGVRYMPQSSDTQSGH